MIHQPEPVVPAIVPLSPSPMSNTIKVILALVIGGALGAAVVPYIGNNNHCPAYWRHEFLGISRHEHCSRHQLAIGYYFE